MNPYSPEDTVHLAQALAAWNETARLTVPVLANRLHTYTQVVHNILEHAHTSKLRQLAHSPIYKPEKPIPGHVLRMVETLIKKDALAIYAENTPDFISKHGYTFRQLTDAANACVKYRTKRKFSQERMARFIGVSVNEISRLERRSTEIDSNLPALILRLASGNYR